MLFKVISAKPVIGPTQRNWSKLLALNIELTNVWLAQNPVNSTVSFGRKYPQHLNCKSEVSDQHQIIKQRQVNADLISFFQVDRPSTLGKNGERIIKNECTYVILKSCSDIRSSCFESFKVIVAFLEGVEPDVRPHDYDNNEV